MAKLKYFCVYIFKKKVFLFLQNKYDHENDQLSIAPHRTNIKYGEGFTFVS